MKSSEIKQGMKVVPVCKTIDGPLSRSDEWESTKNEQKKPRLLYVVRIIDAPGKKPQFVCAASKDAKKGDLFAALDLRPFPWAGFESRNNPGAAKKASPKTKSGVKSAAAKKVTKPASKSTSKPAAKKSSVTVKASPPNGKPVAKPKPITKPTSTTRTPITHSNPDPLNPLAAQFDQDFPPA